jgi:hypothetical protein
VLFGFKWQSGHFEHGGIEIGADHHFVAAGARGNFSWPLDHERFTNSSFVGETFEVTKSSGGIVSIAAVVSNPLSPPFRPGPKAASKPSRQKQIPSSESDDRTVSLRAFAEGRSKFLLESKGD